MGKFIDLSGQTFGEWEVIDYAGKSYWNCTCSCSPDIVRKVHGKSLRNGVSKSCGHDTNVLKDIKGQTFGRWKVLEYAEDGKWWCECQCENKTLREILGSSLRTGHSTNCGCVRSEKLIERNSQGRIRLEGQKFSDWEVLRYYGDKHYICRCSCGRVKKVASQDLVKGISKSCGHNNNRDKVIELSGQVFGELTVLEYLGYKYWKCQCSCGNYTKVLRYNLLTGSVKSCGCKQYDRLSKEEVQKAIEEFYNSNGELPFISDLSAILDRHEAHIRRYIKNYDLQDYINKTYDSLVEREVYNTFKGGELHRRDLIGNGQELDIYYPDYKLAIEFNGDYWHSSEHKDFDYHQKKTLACISKGIRLVHIFEHEWNDASTKNNIINILNRAMNNSENTVENVEIKKVSINDSKNFVSKYVLKMYSTSGISIGCYCANELIGLMTFRKSIINKEYEWELLGISWKSNIKVIDGIYKMLSYFVQHYNPISICVDVDISKEDINEYTGVGFKLCGDYITKPNYKWVKPIENSVLYSYQTQKSKLIEDGLGTEDQTEDEIMKSLGYYKIHDSGNIKLEWIKQE